VYTHRPGVVSIERMNESEAPSRKATVWLKAGAGPVRRFLAASILLGIASGILIVIQTSVLVGIVNGALFEHRTLSELTLSISILAALFLARAATLYASRRAGYASASRVKLDTRSRIVASLRELGPVTLSREHGGELAQTAMDGVEALEGYYARYLPQRAVASLLPLLILAVAFPLDWISGIIFTGTAVFIPLLMVLIGEEARLRNQEQWRQLSHMSSRFLDALRGLGTLKMFGAAGREAQVIARLSEEHRSATMSVVRIAFVSSLMLELITTVSIALVAVTAGFRLLAGEMQFSHAYFILLIAPEFYLPLRTMGNHYHARMAAAAAAERIVELLERPATDAGRTEAVTHELTGQEDIGGGIDIRFEKVSFRYDAASDVQRPPALDELSLSIDPSEHVALFGPSGAGKSTILSLLLRFCAPASGTITSGGVDLGTMDPDRWRAQISWMPQKPTLFSGSILENIRLGRPIATEAEVREAARSARADEFIRTLPLGYDTHVGELGQGFSGGEIQRIALARLFLRDAPLILLDEPGAHLDGTTESLLHEAIAELSRGKTMVIAAHRPSVVDLVDRIVVIENGAVCESGEHRRLVEEGGVYARMMESFRMEL